MRTQRYRLPLTTPGGITAAQAPLVGFPAVIEETLPSASDG